LLWGDSHAQALSYGLRGLLKTKYPNKAFYQVATSACRVNLFPDSESKGEGLKKACDISNEYALEQIETLQPDIVIIAQRDKHDEVDFEEIAKRFPSLKGRFIIVGPVPQWKTALPQVIARKIWQDPKKVYDNSFMSTLKVMDEKLIRKYKNSDYLKYISIMNVVCLEEGCLAKLDDKNTPLVFDSGHLTLEGSRLIALSVLNTAMDASFKLH
jgi:hypothetical protein